MFFVNNKIVITLEMLELSGNPTPKKNAPNFPSFNLSGIFPRVITQIKPVSSILLGGPPAKKTPTSNFSTSGRSYILPCYLNWFAT